MAAVRRSRPAVSACHSCRKSVEARGTNAGSCWHLVVAATEGTAEAARVGKPALFSMSGYGSASLALQMRIDHHCVAMMVTTPPTTERVTAVSTTTRTIIRSTAESRSFFRSRRLPIRGSASDALLCRAPPTLRGQTFSFPSPAGPEASASWLPCCRFARKRPSGQGRSTESDARRLIAGQRGADGSLACRGRQNGDGTEPRDLAARPGEEQPAQCLRRRTARDAAGAAGRMPRQRWRQSEPRDRPTAGVARVALDQHRLVCGGWAEMDGYPVIGWLIHHLDIRICLCNP